MTRFKEKAQGQVKQAVGQMVGDDQLVLEGKKQQHDAECSGRKSNESSSTNEESQKANGGQAPKTDVNTPASDRPVILPDGRVRFWTDYRRKSTGAWNFP
jgi:uncharacterized protein YjbJ (UPF0337 family)